MTSNVYVNVSGTWKQADDVYVNVSGTWKTASEVQARISSEWKDDTSGSGTTGLPTYSQIVGLDYVDFTLPTISVVTSKSSIDGFSLDSVDFTLPVIGITNTTATASLITTNLVVYLDAGNSSSYSGSGTTWTDMSGQGYSASLNNGVSFSSSDGGSLFFDGTDDYAEITSASGLGNFSGNFTIEFWYKTSSHDSYETLLDHYDGSDNLRWGIQHATTDNQMSVRIDGAFALTTSGATVHDDKWHHHVIARVGSTITYYIDTVSRGTATNSSDVGSSGATLRIGAFSGGGYRAEGSLPQLRIYSGTGLTASEVLQNYNATKGNFLGAISTTNLVFYVDAGKSMSYSGSGTTWTDLSSSSNNGTLTNSPTFDSANGGSIVFDGTDDYVQFSSDMFNPNADFTISAWVNLDTATGTNNYTIISDVVDTGSVQLRYKNGSGVQIIDNNVIQVGTFTSSTLSITTWYNVTVTRSSNTYTLYLNGSSTSSFTSSNTYDRGAQSIGINKYNSEKWDGKIAQVFAYSSALSASDVLANYNATKATYGY